MKQRFISYLYFTRKERLGSVVLLAFCAVVFAMPNIREWYQPQYHTDFSAFETAMKSFKAARADSSPTVRLFLFNPNLASRDELLQLGLSERVAGNICNYRDKGGVFRKPDDLGKIWSLQPDDFERIKPYIRLGKEDHSDDDKKTARPEQASEEPLDLNTADSEAFQKLPMVGEKRAAQIIRYRDALGGFVSVSQLSGMYGLPDSVFALISPKLTISTPLLRKLSLNSATAPQLEAHPYISRKQAEIIVSYRNQHGSYKSVEDLRQIRAFSDGEWLQKTLPYLSVE
jgi:DNA uptake protein ComE-like DNA-binding protein